MSLSYQPTCSIDALKARAKLYTQIRQFFAERGVMEVETPVVSQAGVTDVHLASVQALRHINGRFIKSVRFSETMSTGANTTVNLPCLNGTVRVWT